jgi:hypothetical protein
MIRSHGEPSEEEVIFVANAAMELGLEVEDNRKVREVFEEGGDYEAFISGISDRELRLYLFRRVVAATLIDEQINEAELAFIDKTAKSFGYGEKAVGDFLGWMKDGIEWEKRGADIFARL